MVIWRRSVMMIAVLECQRIHAWSAGSFPCGVRVGARAEVFGPCPWPLSMTAAHMPRMCSKPSRMHGLQLWACTHEWCAFLLHGELGR